MKMLFSYESIQSRSEKRGQIKANTKIMTYFGPSIFWRDYQPTSSPSFSYTSRDTNRETGAEMRQLI